MAKWNDEAFRWPSLSDHAGAPEPQVTREAIEEIKRVIREKSEPVTCAGCGKESTTSDPEFVNYFNGPKWLCGRCWQIAFFEDTGRRPGED